MHSLQAAHAILQNEHVERRILCGYMPKWLIIQRENCLHMIVWVCLQHSASMHAVARARYSVCVVYYLKRTAFVCDCYGNRPAAEAVAEGSRRRAFSLCVGGNNRIICTCSIAAYYTERDHPPRFGNREDHCKIWAISLAHLILVDAFFLTRKQLMCSGCTFECRKMTWRRGELLLICTFLVMRYE
jgi:hypothetical protein